MTRSAIFNAPVALPSILQCPVCLERLLLDSRTASCARGHSFDVARQGYINLLLPDTRRSDEPGDSPDMMRSRRAFLQAGFYDQIASATDETVAGLVRDRDAAQIADLGCGEGFFLAHLKRRLSADSTRVRGYHGVDISRAGIRMATSYDRAVTWLVASIHKSPFLPRSLDVVLSMFAPVAPADLRRIVTDAGLVVTVTPGPDHLDALRAVIYPSVEPHAPGPLAQSELFALSSSAAVRYPISLRSHDQIMHLLAMTPYYWNISLETRARVEALTELDVTVDARIDTFRPGAN